MSFGDFAIAAIPGIGSYYGAKDTNETNRAISAEQMRFSGEQAQINRDFQERMSSTAVQRRMADLKAAGLNPVLAATSDASTPAGAMGQSAGIPAVNEIEAALQSALQFKKVNQELDNLQQQERLLVGQQQQVTADAMLKNQQNYKTQAETKKTNAEAQLLSAKVPRAKVEEEIKSDIYGKVRQVWDNIWPDTSSAIDQMKGK